MSKYIDVNHTKPKKIQIKLKFILCSRDVVLLK